MVFLGKFYTQGSFEKSFSALSIPFRQKKKNQFPQVEEVIAFGF